MNTFDKYFLKKDNLLKRRIEIDNSLYEKLVELAEIYDASINKMVNVAIIEMIKLDYIINRIFRDLLPLGYNLDTKCITNYNDIFKIDFFDNNFNVDYTLKNVA